MNEHYFSQLIVGRDRAHVRSILSESPNQNVISAATFFDRVRLLALLYDDSLKRDDRAPYVFALKIVQESQIYPISFAKNVSELYSSLYHGATSPKEALEKAKSEKLSWLTPLNLSFEVEKKMGEHHLVNGSGALFRAWNLIKDENVVPLSLLKTPRIFMRHLVDLTALEIEIIKALSQRGFSFDLTFPLDFAKRSLNVAVDFTARQFETASDSFIELRFDNLAKDGPLRPLVDKLFVDNEKLEFDEQHCEIKLFSTLDEETYAVAARIALLKQASSRSKIALAIRSRDQKAALFKRALSSFGLVYKDRIGIHLLDSEAGILLQTLLSACLYGLRRKDLIALLNDPLLGIAAVYSIKDIRVGELLDELSVEEDRYSEAFSRFKAINQSDARIFELNRLEQAIVAIKECLELIPKEAHLIEFLQGIRLFFAKICNENSSVITLLEHIDALLLSFEHNDATFSLHEFCAILRTELGSITIASDDQVDENAIEFILLPEMLARTFDHVFIPDISFGRLPASIKMDPLISDEQRLQLNKILGRQALRVFLEDPFEPLPVPPRQALEPFWFASAIASAKMSIHFSCASFDHDGSSLLPSDFFMWLKENIAIKPRENNTVRLANAEEFRFLAGRRERLLKASNNEQLQAYRARKNAFLNDAPHAFAFQFDAESTISSFSGRLLPFPKRALTPTMVEAFASCSFYGWLSRIVGLKNRESESQDLDARILGSIAHKTLELFFANQEMPKSREDYLDELISRVGQSYVQENYIAHPELFFCYLDWLKGALKVLVQRLFEQDLHRPLVKEEAFGLNAGSRPALAIEAQGHRYLLGGVVDRVDKCARGIQVMDYKLARLDRLRQESSKKSLLNRNFQVPIYLRLAADAFLAEKPSDLGFAYASIRDGAILTLPLNKDDLDRIFNDEHEESLANAIVRIFAPIKKGVMLAKPGEQCSFCDFAQLCRKAEALSV